MASFNYLQFCHFAGRRPIEGFNDLSARAIKSQFREAIFDVTELFKGYDAKF